MGANPWTRPVLSGLLAHGTRLAPSVPPSPLSSRVGSAYWIRLARYNPEGFYTGAGGGSAAPPPPPRGSTFTGQVSACIAVL